MICLLGIEAFKCFDIQVSDGNRNAKRIFVVSNLALFGQFLSGISLLATACAAVLTAIFYNRRQLNEQWVSAFRTLYGEFWKDDEMAEVRRWIVNDIDYENLEKVLIKRNSVLRCSVSVNEHEVLEKLDRFCSLMIRSKSFGGSSMHSDQRYLWNKLLYDFWLQKIKERNELRNYIKKHWKELDNESNRLRLGEPTPKYFA